MLRHVSTTTTEVFEVNCPHCRSTIEHPKRAYVTIVLGDDGTIEDVKFECDGKEWGQDRT